MTVTLVGPNLSSIKKATQNAYILFYKKYYMDRLLGSDSDEDVAKVFQSLKGLQTSPQKPVPEVIDIDDSESEEEGFINISESKK